MEPALLASKFGLGTILRWKNDPVAFVSEAVRAKPEPWQAEVLWAMVEQDRVAIRSGNGVGKTALLSWLILWWLYTRFPARVMCTAPTAPQLEVVLWNELALWHRKMPPMLREEFEWKNTTFEMVSAPETSFAVARTARREQPESFQGLHSPNMLFIGDEGSGIDEIILRYAQGLLSTAGSKQIIAGNPTRISGYFYDAFHRNVANWWVRKISCFDSRWSREGKIAEKFAADYGEDSDQYRVHVLGEFPSMDENAVIPRYYVEQAVNRDVALNEDAEIIWGVDVARFGPDRTALAKRQGNWLLDPVKAWRGADLWQTAGRIREEYDRAEKKPAKIVVDAVGLGGGVADILKHEGLPVMALNVSEAHPTRDRYLRLKDDLWFRARDWFAARDVRIPDDAPLIAELASVQFETTPSGLNKVENKGEVKRRLTWSPDLADAVVLTFARSSKAKAFAKPIVYLRKFA